SSSHPLCGGCLTGVREHAPSVIVEQGVSLARERRHEQIHPAIIIDISDGQTHASFLAKVRHFETLSHTAGRSISTQIVRPRSTAPIHTRTFRLRSLLLKWSALFLCDTSVDFERIAVTAGSHLEFSLRP